MTTLDELIKQGESFAEQIEYVPAPSDVMRLYPIYEIKNLSGYEIWKATTLRFIGANYPNDKSFNEFESLSSKKINPVNHAKMLALVKALNIVPQTNMSLAMLQKEENKVIVNVNQTQNQENKIILNVFIESIKDELNGKQLKKIKEIMEAYKGRPEEAKAGITETIKGFGENLLSNILANIITNPQIFASFLNC